MPVIHTKEELKSDFIEKAIKKYGNKYDYSKVDYVNSATKVCIICPKHGDFFVTPSKFIYGYDCPMCKEEELRKKKYEDFLKRAREVHGDKYDYSKVVYVDSKTKVCIICPKHGEFWQTPANHLAGSGCRKCYNETLYSTTEKFIENAKKIHGDKYDYSKVNYVDQKTKVCIICPIHGEFWQIPVNHLAGYGCSKCSYENVSKAMSSNTEEFIENARKVHGDKYDYSKVEYVDQKTKVCIICPIHGEFWQTPNGHLSGNGCIKCGNESKSNKLRSNKDEFIENAKKVHGDKYDYSKVEYVDSKTKVCIICPEHGEFWQEPRNHLSGKGCMECRKLKVADGQRLSLDEFIEKARKVHRDKYDYSKVEYVDSKTKVCIICPEHGEFWQTPNGHLNGKGCPNCGNNDKRKFKDTESFIKAARIKFGDKYDYSKVIYTNANKPVPIICPIHGEFYQMPSSHLNNIHGCPMCAMESVKSNTDEFIEKARKVHGDKYDYSKVEYVDSKTKVCIICPEHGEFWQAPNNHLNGQGCPICSESLLEKDIRVFLDNKNIKYKKECKFSWLRSKYPLKLDFYLENFNVAIECQGVQHFEYIEFFCKNETDKHRIYMDKLKYDLCEQHNIKIFYYTDKKLIKDNYEFGKLYTDKEQMLLDIIEYMKMKK